MSDEVKTVPTNASVEQYIAALADEGQRQDSHQLVQLMQTVTGQPPVMWGPSIIGFGTLHYKYASGREGDTLRVGFSARKQALALYGILYDDQNAAAIAQLGKHKQGKGCLYIQRLSDVDVTVLADMIRVAYTAKPAYS